MVRRTDTYDLALPLSADVLSSSLEQLAIVMQASAPKNKLRSFIINCYNVINSYFPIVFSGSFTS
jgi:hypothetical protein